MRAGSKWKVHPSGKANVEHPKKQQYCSCSNDMVFIMMDSTVAAILEPVIEEPPTSSLEKVTLSSSWGQSTHSTAGHSCGGGSASSWVYNLSEESMLDSSQGSFSESPTTSSVTAQKGKGKGKKAKSSRAKGPTLAHRGKASSLLSVGMLNKSMGLHLLACGPNRDKFTQQHLYSHNLEMMKVFTPKDVNNGGSLDSPFTTIKAELKVPEGITLTVE